MKQFLLHVFSFLLMITALLSIITMVTDKGLQHSNLGSFKEGQRIYNGSVNADVLIFGSSHARRGINPAIVDSMLHVNSYNLGMDGYMFDMQYARYNMYRKYNTAPKLIIQCMDYYVLGATGRFIEPEQFYPYLRHKGINDILVHMGMPSYIHYLPFLKYQNYPLLVSQGWAALQGHEADTNTAYKGYKDENQHWDTAVFANFMHEQQYLTPELDTHVVDEFNTFLDSCSRQNIQVVLAFTPHYYRFNEGMAYRAKYMAFLQYIADKHKVPLLDFNKDTMCLHTRYFGNGTHLSREGVALFSKKLCIQLEKDGYGAK